MLKEHPSVHPRVREVTERIRERSRSGRADYLARMDAARRRGSARAGLSCTNLAHGFAASDATDKEALKLMRWPNVAIVSSYNDMLSAHQPLERYPAIIKRAAREAGAVAQFAGGVPAMCDGVTQGQPGMELSLFSRDVIAMATGVALSHNMFDSALCLGICDKIVPGMLMGALAFGHLPVIFVPGGPMPSGVPNKKKALIRQLYAEGKVGRDELLESEAGSYHAAGTCTFYGTANSNQMLMEVMGLHIPGAAFVPPNTELRDAFTAAACGANNRTGRRVSAAGAHRRRVGHGEWHRGAARDRRFDQPYIAPGGDRALRGNHRDLG
jgi:phosphogluconate dehydratase